MAGRSPCFAGSRGAVAAVLALSAVLGCGRPPLVPVEGPREGVFRRTTYRLRGFDPIQSSDVYSSKAVALIYEPLLQYAYRARPYRVEPCLAEGMPDVSEDGLTLAFRIRRGVFFHDDPCFAASGGRGRELTAADFVYSLKRLADLKNGSPGYWAFRGRIAGLDEFRERSGGDGPTDYDRPVAGLEAPDSHTLTIRLVEPYPQLLWVLTLPYAAAVPREAVEHYGDSFINHPVGTGPYMLESWRRNHRVSFVRSPKWGRGGRVEWGPAPGEAGAEVGPLPLLDRIVFYVIDDPSTAWLCFLSAQTDLSAEVSRDNWEVVMTADNTLSEEMRERGIALASIASLDTAYIAFNMDDPIVGPNRKLRQALSCAIDTEELVRYYNGRILRARGPIPPGIAGHREAPSPFAFDLERAKQLLVEAGYPEGRDPATGRRLRLTLELGRTDSETRESSELLIDFMRRIGVVVEPSYNNWPAFLEKISRRQAQMFRIAWLADYPDAQNFLQLFYGPNASPGPNRANYVNESFDRLYDRIRSMQDSPERTALYRRMQDMVIEDAPWIFLFHRMNYSLRHAWLHNYVPHDFPYGVEKNYWIEPPGSAAAPAVRRMAGNG